MTHYESNHTPELADNNTQIWLNERPQGYAELDWVKSDSLMYPFQALTPQHVDTYVDVGTGTGAVLNTLAPRHRLAIGVDISKQMLDQVIRRPGDNIKLIQADTSAGIPIQDASVDLVTERMMLHDLSDPGKAIREAWRILKPGGQFVASEYVMDLADKQTTTAQNKFESGDSNTTPPLVSAGHVRAPLQTKIDFMRSLFSLKNEPNRYLWTGDQFASLLQENCAGSEDPETKFSLKYMSVANWLGKSGFPVEACKQAGLIRCLEADDEIKKDMDLVITVNGTEVNPGDHQEVLQTYDSMNSEDREAMGLDAHWYALFANVSLRKAVEA